MVDMDVPLSSDQPDRHGEVMSMGALKQAENTINNNIIVSHNEHDYTFPPIGRLEKATLLKYQDNVSYLIGKFVLFEASDIEKQNPLGNRIVNIHEQEVGSIQFAYDMNYRSDEFRDDIIKIQELLDPKIEPLYELKKSVETISTLTLLYGIAGVAIGSFVKSFFNEMGKDAWKAIKDLMNKKQALDKEEEVFFHFIFILNNANNIEVAVIFKNTAPDSIEQQFILNSAYIDEIVNNYISKSVDVKKIVFISDGGHTIQHSYSVHSCGTPFDIANKELYLEILANKKMELMERKSGN